MACSAAPTVKTGTPLQPFVFSGCGVCVCLCLAVNGSCDNRAVCRVCSGGRTGIGSDTGRCFSDRVGIPAPAVVQRVLSDGKTFGYGAVAPRRMIRMPVYQKGVGE
jgi:hypothetical protein